jgi:hypothetical protein
MNAAWQAGYADAKAHRERKYEPGPVGVVGIYAFDYLTGYRAGNSDVIWANGNRPPQAERIGLTYQRHNLPDTEEMKP